MASGWQSSPAVAYLTGILPWEDTTWIQTDDKNTSWHFSEKCQGHERQRKSSSRSKGMSSKLGLASDLRLERDFCYKRNDRLLESSCSVLLLMWICCTVVMGENGLKFMYKTNMEGVKFSDWILCEVLGSIPNINSLSLRHTYTQRHRHTFTQRYKQTDTHIHAHTYRHRDPCQTHTYRYTDTHIYARI